jgi:glycosyltransferase involved in cell wall biosynthesis
MLRLIQSLLRRGWTLHFVGPVPPAVAHPGLVFHPVRSTGTGQPSPQTLARCVGEVAAVCLRHRVRYVWSFGAAYSALLAPLRLLPGRKMATFLRGSLEEQERAKGAGLVRRTVARAVERSALVASDGLIVVSRELAARTGRGATVLPNDVHRTAPPSGRDDARHELGLPTDVFLVGYAGSIVPIKRLETLIAAVARLPTVHLALQGFSSEPTPYESSVRALVTRLGLVPRTHLLAWAPSARPFLAGLDVVVVPSRHEGCPNVLLEAMAMGRPCLGARSGGIEEMLVHDGLLFPDGDAGALAARLKGLQEHPAERERLVSLGRERAADYEFDWDERAANALEAVFLVAD